MKLDYGASIYLWELVPCMHHELLYQFVPQFSLKYDAYL